VPDLAVRVFGERTFAVSGTASKLVFLAGLRPRWGLQPLGRQGRVLRAERAGRVVARPVGPFSGPHPLRRVPACDGRTPAHCRVASSVSGAPAAPALARRGPEPALQ